VAVVGPVRQIHARKPAFGQREALEPGRREPQPAEPAPDPLARVALLDRERQDGRRLDLAQRAGVGDDLLAAERAAPGVLGVLEGELGAAAWAFRDLGLLDRGPVEAAL
jgi:hypothetical protein